VYFHYEATMQDRAMALMGKKLTAAQALEGRFSSEGLVAMAGEGASVELALARSLVDRMDEGDARRHWSRTHNPQVAAESALPALGGDQPLWRGSCEPIPGPATVHGSVRGSLRRRVRALCGAGAGSNGRHAGLLF
jgi:hypothetical protein